jgi:hypothetical protein
VKTIHTISPLEKVLQSSGSKPMVFLCDDINYYACKYGKPNNLFNEYLAGAFCKTFNIPIPEFCFVNVLEEHLPKEISKTDFKYACFGSFYLEGALDINDSYITWGNNIIDKIINKNDLLKIGLFDLWLGNEDRNHNNTNLLLNPIHGGYELTAIDHVAIFNTNLLFKTDLLVELTEDESILNTDLVNQFFKRGVKFNETLESIEKDFYICTSYCLKSLSKILAETPNDWKINIEEKEKIIRKSLFSKEWLQSTTKQFRLLLEKRLHKN